jgi:hypothetical protein
MSPIHLSTILLALTVGNFAWQAVTEKAWGVAAERSFFQALALLAAWWAMFIGGA